jgi:hypothetical protein
MHSRALTWRDASCCAVAPLATDLGCVSVGLAAPLAAAACRSIWHTLCITYKFIVLCLPRFWPLWIAPPL